MTVLLYAFLAIIAIGIMVLGYFLMSRLDIFLETNRSAIEKEAEKQEPSCIMLTEEMSDEDITREVRRFREKHSVTRIMIYDGKNSKISENIEGYSEGKQ